MALTCLNMDYVFIIFVPTRWKANSLVKLFGWTYFVQQLYVRRNVLRFDSFMMATTCTIFFTISAYKLNSNFLAMVRNLYEKDKQAFEMKKILEFFPHGVIIQADSEEATKRIEFMNQEFKQQIQNIRYRVEELKNIEISFNANENETDLIKTNLHDYLSQRQKKLNDEQSTEEHRITIKCMNGEVANNLLLEPEDGNDHVVEKIFNVKSMRVDWEGKTSYMHVFIDTTDIVRLEKAQNNIKCQKIMFASVSHEFRTPLNAIMNSYRFISDSLEKLQG